MPVTATPTTPPSAVSHAHHLPSVIFSPCPLFPHAMPASSSAVSSAAISTISVSAAARAPHHGAPTPPSPPSNASSSDPAAARRLDSGDSALAFSEASFDPAEEQPGARRLTELPPRPSSTAHASHTACLLDELACGLPPVMTTQQSAPLGGGVARRPRVHVDHMVPDPCHTSFVSLNTGDAPDPQSLARLRAKLAGALAPRRWRGRAWRWRRGTTPGGGAGAASRTEEGVAMVG